jgi:hypothetical protein
MGSIHKTKSLPRRGYRTQPRVSTLGPNTQSDAP